MHGETGRSVVDPRYRDRVALEVARGFDAALPHLPTGVEDLNLDDIVLEEAEADAARERRVDHEGDGEEW